MSNISMIKCPHCKKEYQNFLATQLKAELAVITKERDFLKTECLKVKQYSKDMEQHYMAELKLCKDLNDIVQLNCNPPANCNDPKVLKTYMKACFEQSQKEKP